MSDWEQRMAERAAIRMREQRVTPEPSDYDFEEHREHHRHLSGTEVFCSCGHYQGTTCVGIPDDYDPDSYTCHICGALGVSGIARP
jgi:hypothetical protein